MRTGLDARTSNRPSQTPSPIKSSVGRLARLISPASRANRTSCASASIRAPHRVAVTGSGPLSAKARRSRRSPRGGLSVPAAHRLAIATSLAPSGAAKAARGRVRTPAGSARTARAKSASPSDGSAPSELLGVGPAARARARAKRRSLLLGSSIQVSPWAVSQSRISARARASIGRNRKRSRPSGHTGEGLHSRGDGVVEPSRRMAAASSKSLAVWPSKITRAPRSRAATANSRWRALRAAADRP